MNPEDDAREPVGTALDEWKPLRIDSLGTPIYAWQLNDGRSSD